MIWGCMAADGVGEMFDCEGRMGTQNFDGSQFQQDNAPCHKSATTWAVLKRKINEHSVTSKTALKNALINERYAMSADECAKLVCSITKRIAFITSLDKTKNSVISVVPNSFDQG
ncbi:uncharacterized protein LOC110117865 [Ceratitis capitata]|uniref:uncharacterized protein LOC110117865 n=1 Tax=Ceratitis capitata TaxID=7213 RepID=UPI000A1188F4|nr:uncharacterized protein LOC110117865 [Ceratitis capitata]